MENIITVKNLKFSFGSGELRQEVLKDINLNIKSGEVVILNGPSGSGKTTLLTIIGGLRLAHHGNVNVLKHELVNSSEHIRTTIRRKIGYIFQQHNLISSLDALRNVCMSLELNSSLSEAVRINRAEKILTAVGLKDRMNYKPSKLSGGQRQRVSIARALVGEPMLILADEPTASLDKNTGHETVKLLKELAKKQGTAILLVTHDARIHDIADRILELEDGRIVNV